MDNATKRYGVPPVVFPHWAHRLQFTCQVCHPAIFRMEAGTHDILMEKMASRGTFCLACHNGNTAWRPVNCGRCHVGQENHLGTGNQNGLTLPTPGPPFAKENGDPNLLLKDFPRNPGGNIDWIKAITGGLISPRSSLTPRPSDNVHVPSDTFMPDTDTLPAVVFPHASHALWLDCRNCHPALFIAERDANQISMATIRAGRHCGKCHGKVAFPITQCDRCHRGRSGTP